jgi:hypothetical protein
MYCWDWVDMEGPAIAEKAAGCTVLKPVFTPANLVLLDAFMFVIAVLNMLATKVSDTVESSTLVAAVLPPVINFVPGAFLISPAKAPAARPNKPSWPG